MKNRELQKLSPLERFIQRVSESSGSVTFILLNAAIFTLWILINMGVLGIKPFDPYPFGMLTMVVSLEAIFLSLFVLLSQNRMQAISDRQNELDLHINLLAERELTYVVQTIECIAQHLGVELPKDPHEPEYKEEVSVTQMVKDLDP